MSYFVDINHTSVDDVIPSHPEIHIFISACLCDFILKPLKVVSNLKPNAVLQFL